MWVQKRGLKMKNLSAKLGIATEGKLSKKDCLVKARKLLAGLKKDKWKGELRRAAVIYSTRYLRKADELSAARKKKSTKKATKKVAKKATKKRAS